MIVGSNKVGKSNLLHALRLVLDPTLPDSARRLRPEEDIWDGVERPFKLTDRVLISVELRGWDGDDNLEALLTEHIVDETPGRTRITYLFQPDPTLTEAPKKEQDWIFSVFAGDDPDNPIVLPFSPFAAAVAAVIAIAAKSLLDPAFYAEVLDKTLGAIQAVSGNIPDSDQRAAFASATRDFAPLAHAANAPVFVGQFDNQGNAATPAAFMLPQGKVGTAPQLLLVGLVVLAAIAAISRRGGRGR